MIGNTILHYRIIEKIGQGGMGEVYRAEDANLGRQVAIKLLPEIFSDDPERLARLAREAKLLASLNHPNIAAIYGLETAEGKHLLILELVEGETLAKRIAKGPLPISDALEICSQIAEGLEAAHEKGIIHRDLKPANIKITPEGKVKILDFGLAKALQGETSAADTSKSPTITNYMTGAGVILGTAAYMSPEQAKGKPVDKRADIWAFGCILYECLTGKRPFEGETATEIVAKILESTPDWNLLPATTPWKTNDLVRRCLQKIPGERLHDIADARIEIQEALRLPVGPAISAGPTAIGKVRRISPILVFTALAGLIVGSVATWLVYQRLRAPIAQPPPLVVSSIVGVAPADRLQSTPWDVSWGDQRPGLPAIALSPDGRFLVFSAVKGNRQQLYLRPMNQLEAVPISDSEGGSNPFFSPDGRWIGFWANGALRKIAVSGGSATTICETSSIFGASWGDDNAIVFTHALTGLFQVAAAGGMPRPVTTLDEGRGEVSHRLPHVLPGAKAVLFTAITHYLPNWEEAEIAVQPLPSGKRKFLTRGADARYVPTGHLVYMRSGTMVATPFNLDRLELGAGAETVIPDVMQAVNTPNAGTESGAAQVAVSRSGLLVYATGGIFRDPERLLVWVDRDGKIQPLPLKPQAYIGPHLSSDGKRILVWTQGQERIVWVYDISRETMTRVTTEGRASRAIWTPDNRRIIFGSAITGKEHLASKAADGSGATERLPVQGSPSSWSPDGRVIAIVQSTTSVAPGAPVPFQYDIVLLSINGADVKPLANSRFNEAFAEFSPDGRWIAYVSDETGRDEVYVQPYPGPGQRQLLSNNGGTQPAWARSGRELFYTEDAGSGHMRMMSVKLTPGTALTAEPPRKLWEGQFLLATPTRGYDVTPDGQRFLMVQNKERPPTPVTQLILVEHWFEELKRLVPTQK